MPAAYLTARGLAAASVSALPDAVARDWQHAYSLALSGQVVTAFIRPESTKLMAHPANGSRRCPFGQIVSLAGLEVRAGLAGLGGWEPGRTGSRGRGAS
jgi:hypothetical protein